MANPYELWDTHRSLGVFRATRPTPQYWLPMFTQQINSTDEYIDFEKLPIETRVLAAFAMPLARGASVYNDKARTFRVKPAYIKLDDSIDPLKPLVKQAGIDNSMLAPATITPMQRLELLKMAIAASHRRAIDLRWDWLAAKAIVDGKVTLTGKDYPTTLVDFGRNANHTIALGSGARFGDSGVSARSFIQTVFDMVNDAEFGGVVTRITMGGAVWSYLSKDAEFLAHMDLNTKGGAITIERGLTIGKIFKVGEMNVGGASGQSIELWVNNETYVDPVTGATERYVGSKQMVFTSDAAAIQGYRCFGRIIDQDADYEPLAVFPKNYEEQIGDIKVQRISHKSAPLMLPVNPDATASATVLA